MELKYCLIADSLILLVLFCESCGRGVIRPEGVVFFPDSELALKNENVLSRSYNWYSTLSPHNSFNNRISYYGNQNVQGYSPGFQNPYKFHPEYFGRVGQESTASGLGDVQHNEFSMSSLLRPIPAIGFGTEHLIRINSKGFALLGLLGLMAILVSTITTIVFGWVEKFRKKKFWFLNSNNILFGQQGLLTSVVAQFGTTTTASTAATAPTAAANLTRFKRDLLTFHLMETDEQHIKIVQLLLPSLDRIALIQVGRVPAYCVSHELCLIRTVLMSELPEGKGQPIVDKFFEAIFKFLKKTGHQGIQEFTQSNCLLLYPKCT